MGRCVTVLWVTMTTIFTCGICFAIMSPVWFENKTQPRHDTTPFQKSSAPSEVYDPVAFGLIRYFLIINLTLNLTI